jgi:hypothetical protein
MATAVELHQAMVEALTPEEMSRLNGLHISKRNGWPIAIDLNDPDAARISTLYDTLQALGDAGARELQKKGIKGL